MERWKQTLAELAGNRGAALKRHAFLLCGDDSQAEDLVQEALVRAFGRPSRGPRPGAAEAYVRVIMVNLFIDGVRWRRRKTIAVISGACAAAAVAIAVPVMLAGTGHPPSANPAVLGTQLSYRVTVNGQSKAYPTARAPGPVPRFAVTQGEELMITVDVTVPSHTTVHVLWLGISAGTLGGGSGSPGSPSQPAWMSPVLAVSPAPLGPGAHRFRSQWTVPAGLSPGAVRLLAVDWAVDNGETALGIAELAVQHSPHSVGGGSHIAH